MEYSFNLIAMDGAAYLSTLFCLAAAASSAASDTANRPQSDCSPWLIGGFIGESRPILGSDEIRRGGGIFLQYERREPKFVFPKGVGDLVFEGYYATTFGGPVGDDADVRLNTVGLMAMARWRWPQKQRGVSIFTDLGWGLAWGDRTTVDLDSHVNSTPVLDFGLSIGPKDRELLVGVRYLHLSDGGLKGRNQGQNQFHLFLAKRL